MAFSTEVPFVEAAENALGVKFPSALRTHLLACNGGEVEALAHIWAVHPVLDGTDARRAKRSASHIAAETQAAREWRDFPEAAVSIGTDGSGNHLVLLPRVEDPSILGDGVYVWWHESAELEFVAPDFASL